MLRSPSDCKLRDLIISFYAEEFPGFNILKYNRARDTGLSPTDKARELRKDIAFLLDYSSGTEAFDFDAQVDMENLLGIFQMRLKEWHMNYASDYEQNGPPHQSIHEDHDDIDNCVQKVDAEAHPGIEEYSDEWNNIRYANIYKTNWYIINEELFDDLWHDAAKRLYPMKKLYDAIISGRVMKAHKIWFVHGNY